jgi:hypothetical protein
MRKKTCLAYSILALLALATILFLVFFGYKRIGRGNVAYLQNMVTNRLARDENGKV